MITKERPHHVAIIMDGNRRWAATNSVPVEAGHWRGSEILMDVVKAAIQAGVKVLTVYGFSTENWTRTPIEIDALMRVLKKSLVEKRGEMLENGVRLETIGELSRFPKDVRDELMKSKEATREGQKIRLVLALNYGARDELKRAIGKILDDFEDGKIRKEECTEELIANYLDTADIGDPDLLIRTSGEKRISNFLLWQISYSEVYLTDVLWPDFKKDDFMKAIDEYQKRQRRLGT